MSATAAELTARQRDVLRLIFRLTAELGVPPTIRELGTLLGVGSPNATACHLEALERKGYLLPGAVNWRGRADSQIRARCVRLAGVRWVPEFTDDEAGRRAREAIEGEEVGGG